MSPWRRRRQEGAGRFADALWAARDTLGVTRLADLTRLDDLGVPVYAAVRDDAVPRNVSVSCGRGWSHDEARAGALAEALESRAAEPLDGSSWVCTSQPSGRSIDPRALILPQGAESLGASALAWCAGREVGTGDEVWVPANAVYVPFQPPDGTPLLFGDHSVGLGVGATASDATFHGLLECFEVDARSRARALATISRGDLLPRVVAPTDHELVRRASEAGIGLAVRDITSDLGVPTMIATLWERLEGGGVWAHLGCAADPDPHTAFDRALLEAAQSRLTDIQGGREDLPEPRSQRSMPWIAGDPSTPTVTLESLRASPDVLSAESLCEKLQEVGLAPPITVDLSIEGVVARVVRVIAPGLEVWATDQERIGLRMERWLHEAWSL